MLTCCNRYRIDPARREAFADYARAWVALTNRHGGTHHGFYAATELANCPASSYPGMSAEAGADVAYAWVCFSDEASLHAFRAAVKRDPDCAAAEALGRESGAILAYERSFLERVA